jgi:hypothetical protein
MSIDEMLYYSAETKRVFVLDKDGNASDVKGESLYLTPEVRREPTITLQPVETSRDPFVAAQVKEYHERRAKKLQGK